MAFDDEDPVEVPVIDDEDAEDEDEEDVLAAGFTEVDEAGNKVPDPLEEDEAE